MSSRCILNSFTCSVSLCIVGRSAIVSICVLQVFSVNLSAICVILFRLPTSCVNEIFCVSTGKLFSETTFKCTSVIVLTARVAFCLRFLVVLVIYETVGVLVWIVF